jgi:hypothetical protein
VPKTGCATGLSGNEYGYGWEVTGNTYRLVPNGDWPSLKLIFDRLLGGDSYKTIIKELRSRGILRPSGPDPKTGDTDWNSTTLSQFAHNPVYTGRYYALKKEAVTPKRRRGQTTGNSSVKSLPFEQQTYLREVEVVNPPITWEQRGQIVEQLARHQRLSTRNAKRSYLLRGMIFCETHRGKKGEPRGYHGRPYRGGRWVYVCPGGTGDTTIDGPVIEKYLVARLGLDDLDPDKTPDSYYQGFIDNRTDTGAVIDMELADLVRREDKRIAKLVDIEDRYKTMEPSVYNRLKAQYERERVTIKERNDLLLDQRLQLSRLEQAKVTIGELRAKHGMAMIDAFNQLDNAEPKDWIQEAMWPLRQLFEAYNLQVHVDAPETPGTFKTLFGLGMKPVWLRITMEIQIAAVKNDIPIVSARPERG